jgi:ankyrin repeat protein
MPNVKRGLVWLLEHGANPNVLCAKEQENCLHVSARRGQDVSIVQLLLDHGADLNARRADGSTAWLLARRGGFEAIASLLERAGAETQPLSPVDELLSACGRGDVEAARRLATPDVRRALSSADHTLLPDAAAAHRWSTVAACVAAGFPVDTPETTGATALHYAALRGNLDTVQLLLRANPDLSIRDREHSATPLGWATWAADFMKEPSGNYPATIRALVAAGAQLGANENVPANAEARAALEGDRERPE